MFVSHSDSPRPAVALVSAGAEEARAIAEHLRPEDLGGVRPLWLVCSVAGASVVGRSAAWRRFFHGGIFVEPHMPELEDFKDYFVSSLQVTFFSLWLISTLNQMLCRSIYILLYSRTQPTTSATLWRSTRRRSTSARPPPPLRSAAASRPPARPCQGGR